MTANRARSLSWIGAVAGLLVLFALVAWMRARSASDAVRRAGVASPGAEAGAAEVAGDALPTQETDRNASATENQVERELTGLVAARRVAGRVLDEREHAIIGARCQLRRARRDTPSDEAASLAALSDFDGRFSIEADGDPLGCVLVVSFYGREPAYIDVPAGEAKERLLVRLASFEPIVGRVLWPNGQPAEKASVFVDDEERALDLMASARTDAQGRFAIEGAGDGPFVIRASASRQRERRGGHWKPDGIDDESCSIALVAPLRAARPVPELTLMLRADLFVRGRVIDEHGAPWTRFRIAAVPILAGDDEGSPSQQVGRNIEAADGSFELRGLHDGEWLISAAIGTTSTGAQRVELHAGDEAHAIELTLPRGARIAGRVLDARDRAVHGASVRLCAPLGTATWLSASRGSDVRTNADGRFEFTRIEPTPARVELVACSETSCSEVVSLSIDSATAIDDLELRLPPEGKLSVSVSGASTRSAKLAIALDDTARVELCWIPAELSGWNGLSTRADGVIEEAQRVIRRMRCGRDTFTLRRGTQIELAAGIYFVRVSMGDMVSAVQRVNVLADASIDVQLALEPAVALLPYLRGAPRPAEDLDVRVFDEAGSPASLSTTDELRQPRRILVPPGHYRVEARMRDGRHAEREVDVTRPTDDASVGVELDPRQ